MLGGLWNYIKKLFSGKSRRRQRLEKRQEDVARRVRIRQSGGTYLQRAFKTKRWKQTQVQGGQPPVWPDTKAAGPPVEKNTPQEALERRVAPPESPDVFTHTPAPEATREPPADTGGHVVKPKAFLDDEGNETGQQVPPEGPEESPEPAEPAGRDALPEQGESQPEPREATEWQPSPVEASEPPALPDAKPVEATPLEPMEAVSPAQVGEDVSPEFREEGKPAATSRADQTFRPVRHVAGLPVYDRERDSQGGIAGLEPDQQEPQQEPQEEAAAPVPPEAAPEASRWPSESVSWQPGPPMPDSGTGRVDARQEASEDLAEIREMLTQLQESVEEVVTTTQEVRAIVVELAGNRTAVYA